MSNSQSCEHGCAGEQQSVTNTDQVATPSSPQPQHYGYHEDKNALLKRLARIQGQVGGIAKMVEDDKYCIDILTQISAVKSALNATALKLLDEHLQCCVKHAVEAGGGQADQKLTEVTAAVQRLLK